MVWVTAMLRGFYFCCYPSSHNHGSAEHDPNLYLKKRVLGDTPIFHFHEYGRKSVSV